MKTATRIGWGLCLAASMSSAHAQSQPVSARFTVSPLYSQRVAFSMPAGFQEVFEKDSGSTSIREAVLVGETLEQWTQMITVKAAKGLAANPRVNPRIFVGSMADGFQKLCATSFTATVLSEGQLETGHLAFTALLDCGPLGAGKQTHLETLLVSAFQGAPDVYSLQWAEHSRAVEGPVKAPPCPSCWLNR